MKRYKERCNILVVGTLASGSSVVHDLLKEYDNVGCFSKEFDDFRAPGLVADQLSYTTSINFPNKINQITRIHSLIKRLFFKSLIWRWMYNAIPKKYLEIDYNLKRLENIKERIIRLNQFYLLNHLNKRLKSKISFEEKIQISNEWIQQIDNNFSIKKDYILRDQPLLTTIDLAIWKAVFKPFKLIVVYRDPRDQLTDIINRGILFKPYGSPYINEAGVIIADIYGKDKRGAIRFQIEGIKKRLINVKYLEKELDPNELLMLDFEGMVNNYDEYKDRIEDFVGGIKGNHKYRKKYFDPANAKEKIGIYKKYLSDDDLEELSDLEDWYADGNQENRGTCVETYGEIDKDALQYCKS